MSLCHRIDPNECTPILVVLQEHFGHLLCQGLSRTCTNLNNCDALFVDLCRLEVIVHLLKLAVYFLVHPIYIVAHGYISPHYLMTFLASWWCVSLPFDQVDRDVTCELYILEQFFG